MVHYGRKRRRRRERRREEAGQCKWSCFALGDGGGGGGRRKEVGKKREGEGRRLFLRWHQPFTEEDVAYGGGICIFMQRSSLAQQIKPWWPILNWVGVGASMW